MGPSFATRLSLFSQCNARQMAQEEDRNLGGELSAKHTSLCRPSEAISDWMQIRRMAILMIEEDAAAGIFFRCLMIDGRVSDSLDGRCRKC